MSNMPFFSYDLADTAEAITAFSDLGRGVPIMALTDVPLGPLHDFDRANLDLDNLYASKLKGHQARYFCELGEGILSSLTGGKASVPLVQERFYGSDMFEEGFGNSRGRHVFRGDDLPKVTLQTGTPLVLQDDRMHNDNNERSIRGVIYCIHITTAGSGIVEAASALKLPPETRKRIESCFIVNNEVEANRSFTVGDAHIFIRQGTVPNPTEEITYDVTYPTSHHFISDLGGRSYVENSFALEEEWHQPQLPAN